MPLPFPRTAGSTVIRSFGNAYFDAGANTIEFGARVYNTPEAARERALSHPIRDNLTYLGPIEINTSVSDAFVDAGVTADAPRRQRIADERAALEREQREQEAASNNDGGADAPAVPLADAPAASSEGHAPAEGEPRL
jgi:hypothetical protein